MARSAKQAARTSKAPRRETVELNKGGAPRRAKVHKANTAIAVHQGREDLYKMDPDRLVLITDPADPLYDPRALKPPDEALVRNIAVAGVHTPILVERRGQQLAVVFGRRRVLAARELNRRYEAQGAEERVTVPCRVRKGSPGFLSALSLSENALRKDVDAVELAEKTERWLAVTGKTIAEAADAIGLTPPMVGRLLKLNSLTPKVKDAIHAGKLSANAALPLTELPASEQAAALKTLEETGAITKDKALDKPQRPATTRDVAKALNRPVAPTKKEIRERWMDEQWTEDYRAALAWVLGEGDGG